MSRGQEGQMKLIQRSSKKSVRSSQVGDPRWSGHVHDVVKKPDTYALEKQTWAEMYSPEWLLPYIQLSRINRPAGNYLVLWPFFWGVAYAAPIHGLPNLTLLVHFTIMTLVMRSGGCVVNDMWDKDFDKQVERTNCRPLASGAISYTQASVFLALHFVAGFAIFYPLNQLTIQMGALSIFFIALYPAMKRLTYWPQAWLGLTINFGILMAWAAVRDDLDWSLVSPLYCAAVFWTLVYDTLYAHQDKKDDARIGVKSTALLFGNNTVPILNLFSVITVVSFVVAGIVAQLSNWYFAGVAICALQLVWQVNTADLNDPLNLQQRFNSNIWFGALIFASIVAGKVFV